MREINVSGGIKEDFGQTVIARKIAAVVFYGSWLPMVLRSPEWLQFIFTTVGLGMSTHPKREQDEAYRSLGERAGFKPSDRVTPPVQDRSVTAL
jgi:hypothetical protein